MTEAGSGPDPAKETVRLARRLERLELNLRHLEEIRDTNARLLDKLMLELATERARSEALLLNILPQRIVDRLNAGEERIADRHEDVAVIFTDFVGFTGIAASLEVGALVDELGSLFAAFDAASDRFGVEKIKTVGDAYLAVAGLSPTPTPSGDATADGAVAGEPAAPRPPVELAADVALEIVRVVAEAGPPWQVRIGLAVGPVVAGVIGTRTFAYDVWGDTVNLASRLESTCQPGRIHVSAETAARLADGGYELEARGPVALKGKGEVPTFYLVRR